MTAESRFILRQCPPESTQGERFLKCLQTSVAGDFCWECICKGKRECDGLAASRGGGLNVNGGRPFFKPTMHAALRKRISKIPGRKERSAATWTRPEAVPEAPSDCNCCPQAMKYSVPIAVLIKQCCKWRRGQGSKYGQNESTASYSIGVPFGQS